MTNRHLLALASLGSLLPVVVNAQGPPPGMTPPPSGPSAIAPPLSKQFGETGILNFNCTVGSFKILGAGERPAEGTVTLKCSGTVLVSGLKGTVTPVGMRREIDDQAHGKQGFFGTGTITIRGKFSAIQWFGRELTGQFNGWGVMRLYGEFDRNLDTGQFWFADAPEKKAWGNGGNTVFVPRMRRPEEQIVPRVRTKPKP